jgi:hypothetical protein
MWSDNFENHQLKKHLYNTIYKYFLLQNSILVHDIINLINNHEWYITEFKIPLLSNFINNQYINEQCIVFERVNVDLDQQHLHEDKEVIMKIENKKITEVMFFYIDDIHHYYRIHFLKSDIKNITMKKQDYKMYKRYDYTYVSSIDPTLIIK